MASVRTTRLLRASTIRPDRPNGGRDRSVTAPLYSRSREPPADAVASRCLGSVPLQEVLDGVLNAFGSRMGVGDPLDRDDVSTTMCQLVHEDTVARALIHAPLSLQVGQHPATSLALEQAGEWARAHVPIKCVEYLVGDDETAYWLHLAVLGNARQGPRTGDNATYELTPALVRWLTPGGLPYGIADLPALPSDIRNELDIVAQFGTAAVVKRRGTSSCEER